jgi:hypothetical protein
MLKPRPWLPTTDTGDSLVSLDPPHALVLFVLYMLVNSVFVIFKRSHCNIFRVFLIVFFADFLLRNYYFGSILSVY